MKRRWESTKQQQMLLRSHRASRSSPSALLRGRERSGGAARAGPAVPAAGGRKALGGPRRLLGSLPPSRPRPAGGHTSPSRPPTRAGAARPACSAGPRQRKEGSGDEPGRGGDGSPAPPGRARPPHPCALSRGQLRRRAK